jgi:hypothetical protein
VTSASLKFPLLYVLPGSFIRKFILILADIKMKGKDEGKTRSKFQAAFSP